MTNSLDIDLTTITTDGIVMIDKKDDVVDADLDTAASGLPKNAWLKSDGSVELTLDYPVSMTLRRGGQTDEVVYKDFTLRRLTGQDLRKALAAKPDLQPVILFACSSGILQLVAEKLFDKMDLTDIDAVAKVLDFFGKSGPKTGR